MQRITRSQVLHDRWVNTSYLRTDGKDEYRERKEHGNKHAVFEKGAEIGYIHTDEFNATNFPIGTVNHFSNWVEEKTGIPKWLTNLAVIGVTAYVGYRALK